MEVVTFVSGKLDAVGYDKSTNTLIIEIRKHWANLFQSRNRIYSYDKVPPNIHTELMSAPSKDKFYAENIKDNFNSRRID